MDVKEWLDNIDKKPAATPICAFIRISYCTKNVSTFSNIYENENYALLVISKSTTTILMTYF